MTNTMENKKTIGITGASGALGQELIKLFRQKGHKVIGLTHSKTNPEKRDWNTCDARLTTVHVWKGFV